MQPRPDRRSIKERSNIYHYVYSVSKRDGEKNSWSVVGRTRRVEVIGDLVFLNYKKRAIFNLKVSDIKEVFTYKKRIKKAETELLGRATYSSIKT